MHYWTLLDSYTPTLALHSQLSMLTDALADIAPHPHDKHGLLTLPGLNLPLTQARQASVGSGVALRVPWPGRHEQSSTAVLRAVLFLPAGHDSHAGRRSAACDDACPPPAKVPGWHAWQASCDSVPPKPGSQKHRLGCPEPVPLVVSCTPHAVQAVAPVSEKKPTAHASHAALPVPSRAVPAGHGSHPSVAWLRWKPGSHRQCRIDELPLVSVVESCGQAVHVTVPVLSANVLTGHGWHCRGSFSLRNSPSPHATHASATRSNPDRQSQSLSA